MILAAIVALSAVVITAIVAIFANMPVIPAGYAPYVVQLCGYVGQGVRIFNAFTHAEIVVPLLGVLIGVNVIYRGYKFAMWCYEKVPMLGVH